MDGDATLIDKFRQGDGDAAAALFQRYVGKLIGLAHNSLSSQLGRRVDAEDVVQSAFNTFFAGARDGRFNVERGQDLWRLLAVLTITKLRKQVEFHTADKRNFQLEKAKPLEDASSQTFNQVVDSEPSPQDTAALLEQIAALKADLGPKNEEILTLRLEGYHVTEIAEKTGRSERTVRRILDKVKERLLEQASTIDPTGSISVMALGDAAGDFSTE